MIYATVCGNLGGDGEVKSLSSGKPVCNFSVAAKNGKDGTVWVRCGLFGERATKLSQYLTKGKQVTVMGPLKVREHNGKTYHDMDVQEIALQGGKSESRTSSGDAADDEPPPF